VQAEARPLVVLAEREAPEARDGVRIVTAEVVGDRAAELAHPRERLDSAR
jgi:hypothetical protein